jgi:Tfp pilus assembly pilus retraction ATPase PilT
MRLMDDSLQELYINGVIAAEECMQRATDPVMMEKFIKEHPVA